MPGDGSIKIAALEKRIKAREEANEKDRQAIAMIRDRNAQRQLARVSKAEDAFEKMRGAYMSLSLDALWDEAAKYSVTEDDFEHEGISQEDIVSAIMHARLNGVQASSAD